ncbi:MAG TPA: response regulator [Burkholderiaceae bacterium]|nr:response regulator [Burkholderiaceae bacterium]
MTEPVSLLLVDDNPSNLDALAAVLEPSGYRLIRAHSAQEALLALLDGDFAAIVLDIEMPGLNGIELAQLIKQRKRTRDVPILFLTAFHVDERDVLQGYVAGAADYLSKPIHPEILRFKISVFAELFRKSRALAVANDALSREVSERVQAQNALHEANEMLERRVHERTLELVRAVENERLARAEAEAQGRLKENFLAVISHELRTPLNAIYGWCKVLGRPGLDAAALARGLAVIERNALGQARLIEDLLDMSGIDAGHARLALQPVDVLEVLRTAVQATGPAAASAGLRIAGLDDVEPPPLSRRTVQGDPSRLQQVIGNLLNNAVKFTPRGGCVTVGLRSCDAHVEVSVEDSGEGIDAGSLAHVFDKFWQADSSTRRRHGGLGLGLSIVRQLVLQHGGNVSAHSEGVGRGARFVVTLPLAAPGTSTDDGADADGPSAVEADVAEERLQGVRVLLVDDDPDALEVVQMLLVQQGARVSVVTSADEALRRLESDDFDALITDVGMPGKDGYGLISEWRGREAPGRRLPAVALTAFAGPDARRRALLEGFDDHVVKPVGLRTLVEVVGPLVERASRHGTRPSSVAEATHHDAA